MANENRSTQNPPHIEAQLELERLRAENLKREHENLVLQKELAEASTNSGMMADAERREAATVARIKAEREECLRKLQDGPNKYWVHLAHQLPTGRSKEHPELLVGGRDKREAEHKYQQALGIIHTPHKAAVIPAIEGEEAPSELLIAKAEEGYLRQG